MERVLLVFAAVAAFAGCGGGGGADGSLSVETVVLEGPAGGEAVYEPHVAVAGDGRVLVAAQYGVGYNRGGLRFWTARSGPDGSGWEEGEAVPQPLTADPTMAADATVAIGPDGTRYLLGLSADSTRGGVPDASLVLATAPPGGGPFTHRLTLARVEEPSPGVLTATDKPWMALDPDTSAGPAGTLYLGWTALTVHLDRDPIEIERTLMVATSRDGGANLEPAVSVAAEGLGVQLAVRPNGTVDAVWTELRDEGNRPATRLVHSVSKDRGRTFSEAAVLVELDEGGGGGLGHAALAAGDDGTLMACWPQGPESAEGWAVWCSRFHEGGGWGPAAEVDAGPDVLAVSFPAVAAAGGSWWLSAYVATGDSVTVELFPAGGDAGSWNPAQSLASAAVPFDRYCPAPGLPCRSDETTVFPGDYVSAAARGDLVAVAWVLPGADAVGRLGVSVVGVRR